MKKSKPYIQVVAALIRRENHILIAQRGSGRFAGYWEFPGGKLEAHEQRIEALARELFEELELEISEAELLMCYGYAYPDFNVDLSFFQVHLAMEQNVLVSHVHSALKWVDPGALASFKFLPSNALLIEQIQASCTGVF